MATLQVMNSPLQQFLNNNNVDVDPKIIAYLTGDMRLTEVRNFATFWSPSAYEHGVRDDIVAKVEPYRTDMSSPASRVQVARLRTAWKLAQEQATVMQAGSGTLTTAGSGTARSFPTIKFSYFNVEGGGECIRLAFALGGVPYIDDRIDMATQWRDLKPKAKFGQLPVITVDGGEQIAQSGAMLRYAGKLAGLIPEDPVEMMKAEEVIGLSWDLVTAITPSMQLDRRPQLYGYQGTPQAELTRIAIGMREKLSAPDGDIDRFLGYLDGLLAKNGTGWFVGSSPTIAECEMIPRLRSLRKGNRDGFPKDIVNKHVNLMKMYFAFHELPAIKAHYKGVPPY